MIHLGYHEKAYVASLIYNYAARRYFEALARLNHTRYVCKIMSLGLMRSWQASNHKSPT